MPDEFNYSTDPKGLIPLVYTTNRQGIFYIAELFDDLSAEEQRTILSLLERWIGQQREIVNNRKKELD